MMKLKARYRKAALATGKDGSFCQMTRHFAAFYRRSPKLVVTFDHMKSRDQEGPRFPWGYEFLKKRGVSHLGIMMTRRNDWFRHGDLFDYFDDLKTQGFFGQFEDVLFYGSSMGGYGACAYAAAAPGARILALMPQSTLARDLVPDETRYRNGFARGDWDDPRYRDGADGVATSSHTQLIYDPYFAADRLHADRLQGDQVEHVKAFFTGHSATRALHFNGLLKQVLDRSLAGKPLGQQAYYRAFRDARRKAPNHMRSLAQRALAGGSAVRLDTVLRVAEQRTTTSYPRFKRMREELCA